MKNTLENKVKHHINDATEMVCNHEGYRKKMYKCPAGKNTIGYGLNLDAGLDKDLAKDIVRLQLLYIENRIICDDRLRFYNTLENLRKEVILDIIFNIGYAGFLKFKKTIALLNDIHDNRYGYKRVNEKYKLVADELKDSKWYKQVGNRSKKLVRYMETGYIS